VVAVIGALMAWQGMTLSRYDIAHLAYELERKDVGVPGGMQDQYAAAFGGFNLIEFRGESDVVVNPLRVDSQLVHELEYNSLLVFTGATRLSSHIIANQISGYTEGRPAVVDALAHMKQLANEAKTALLRGRITELGEILHQQWLHKKATSSSISNPAIDEMYAEARGLGAVGGKMSGAGGGGYMYLICPFDRRPDVSARLTELGASTGPVEFVADGMQSWIAGSAAHTSGTAVA
jgi:D-glycero-alpha-D-manno-heptose-7-phosphate kinase